MSKRKKQKKKKQDIKDLVIKIILIIIIILLLLHNCSVLRKNSGIKKPSGNVNIIEIMCDNTDTCKNNDKKEEASREENDSEDYKKNSYKHSNKNSFSKVNDNNINSNSNADYSSGSANEEKKSPNQSTDEEIIDDEDGRVLVKDNKVLWSENTELKIFSNSYYTFENKIAPETSNTYKFIVKNSTDLNLKYNISFTEINPYNINMKYRLKKNNNYIVNNYVPFNQLNIENQLLSAKKEDTFYLDWKWFSSDHDNAAGENGANYKLNILVKAEST